MTEKHVRNVGNLPPIVGATKRGHYREIFGPHADEVLAASPLIAEGEFVLLCMSGEEVLGWVNVLPGMYAFKVRGFTVLPQYRGRGIARFLMEALEREARSHHERLEGSGEKPYDVQLVYVDSLVYLDAPELEGEAFAFGKFLRKQGFVPCVPNKAAYAPEEKVAAAVYARLYPGHVGRLRVFRKLVVRGGVRFDEKALAELRALSGEALDAVMRGLDAKLGHFETSGRVSYRFDICPICAFTGSSEEDDSACKGCCIRVTCSRPWDRAARFKEDYQLSYAYFHAMREFLRDLHGVSA